MLLRHVIEIQQRVDTTDSLGEPIADWQTVREVRANVEPMAGEEIFRSDTTLSLRPVKFTIRYDESWVPNALDRIVWQDDDYDIKSVVDRDGRRRFHEILAVLGA